MKPKTLTVFRIRYDSGIAERRYASFEVAAGNATDALALGLANLPDGGEFRGLEVVGSTMVVAA